jgi:RNA polymerase sigma-70 factor (ECF subfamily)
VPHHDADLIKRAREGDEAAFEELYERYRPSIYTYIYYRTNDAGLAEELTSEVFTRLVSKIWTLRIENGSLLPWLYTVARNLVIECYRQRARRQWLPLDEQLAADDSSSPSVRADQQLTQAQLAAALDSLTETQRQVILLKFVEGHSNAEVGKLLGKDEGSIKSLQHRGLAALRRVLATENTT